MANGDKYIYYADSVITKKHILDAINKLDGNCYKMWSYLATQINSSYTKITYNNSYSCGLKKDAYYRAFKDLRKLNYIENINENTNEYLFHATSNNQLLKTYQVYLFTFPNNKVYVGISSREHIEKRWNNGDGYRHQTKIYTAIKQFGWDNIQKQILYSNLSETDARRIEHELIQKYNSVQNGYNTVM